MDGDATAPVEDNPSGAGGGRWHAATQINSPDTRKWATTAPVKEPPAAPEPPAEPRGEVAEPAPLEPEPVEPEPEPEPGHENENEDGPDTVPEAPRLFAPPEPEPQPIESVAAAPATAPVVPARPHRRRALLVIGAIVAARCS